jgi:hypothetical protein
MESLETKKKRLEFLKEIKERGLESGLGQIERTQRDIAFMEFSIMLENIRKERNVKIDTILKSKTE